MTNREFHTNEFLHDAAVNSHKPTQTNEPYRMKENVKVFSATKLQGCRRKSSEMVDIYKRENLQEGKYVKVPPPPPPPPLCFQFKLSYRRRASLRGWKLYHDFCLLI